MQDEIGQVIARGLADTFVATPQNPIEYFAKWLLNYKKTERAESQQADQEAEVINLKKKKNDQLKRQEDLRQALIKKEKDRQKENEAFWSKLT